MNADGDILDLVKDEVGSIDWHRRGQFKCEKCERVLATLGGLKCHALKHGDDYANSIRSKIKAAEKAAVAAKKERDLAEKKRLEERKRRKVTLSTDQIDEITGELTSLIGMMEPYYSQGNSADDAYALIAKLEAMAEGRS